MRKLTRIFALAALAATLAAAGSAWSQERGAYFGGSIGQGSYKHTCEGATTGIACDNSDTAARIFAGYQFTPRVAIEMGFHNLGAVVARGSGPAGITESADLSAIDVVYVGSWRLGNRFSLLGKLGFYFGEVKPATPSTPSGRNWETDSTTDITYGVGASYALTEHADFRFEWQHFGHLGTGGSAPQLDIHLFSLGAVYRF